MRGGHAVAHITYVKLWLVSPQKNPLKTSLGSAWRVIAFKPVSGFSSRGSARRQGGG